MVTRTKKQVSTRRIEEASTPNLSGSVSDQAAQSPSKREQILDAAVTVFSTRGYRATLVDEIAQEAGVAKGTLYLYFQSKEQMYMEALRENIEKLHALTSARMEEASSTWDKIKALVAARLEFGKTHKDFLRIYLYEFAVSYAAQGKVSQRIKALVQKESDQLRCIFEKGIRAGEVRAAPPEQLVAILQDIVRGIMAGRVIEMRPSESELNADQIVDLLRKGLGVER